MTTALVYDAVDARAYADSDRAAERVIALTPNAQAALLAQGVAYLRPRVFLDDQAHAEIETGISRAQTQMAEALTRVPVSDLNSAARVTLHHDLRIVMAIVLVCRVLLDKGPWRLPLDSYAADVHDIEAAQLRLMERLYGSRARYRQMLPAAVFGGVSNFVSGLIARCVGGRNTVAVTGYQYGLGAIAARFGAAQPPLHCVQVRAGGTFGFLHALMLIVRRFSGGDGTLAIAGRSSGKAEAAAAAALQAVEDPGFQNGVEMFGGDLLSEAARAHGLVSAITDVMSKLKPRAALAHTLRWGDEAALGAGAQAAGVPVFLASHGTHAEQTDGPARSSVDANADGLLTSPFANTAVAQSPHADALAQRMQPDVGRLRSTPVMWGTSTVTARSDADDVFRFLHAGTSKPLTGPRPFLYETADEYVAGLIELVDAVAALPDTELIVRVRGSAECSVEALKALLPKADNVIIKTDGTFAEDLSRADALISFASTTIEEALAAHRPVVLWGGTRRYRHLTARETPPASGDRGVVYAPPSTAQLPAFLGAVKDSHWRQPLTETELGGHVWPSGTAGVDGLLTAIRAGKGAPA